MQRSITEALEYCAATGIRRISLFIPASIPADDIASLRGEKSVVDLYLPPPDDTAELGAEPGGWLRYVPCPDMPDCVPRAAATPVVIANRSAIPLSTMLRAALRGKGRIICQGARGYIGETLLSVVLWRTANGILEAVQARPESALLGKVHALAFGQPMLRRIWKRIFRRGDEPPVAQPDTGNGGTFNALLAVPRADTPYRAKPGRILHVSEGLGPGGAERQIVETLLGLKKAGIEDIGFVGFHLNSAANLRFHAGTLERHGIDCLEPDRRGAFSETGRAPMPLALLDALAALPGQLAADIRTLTGAIQDAKPEIVHAWQDDANIKAGIAAVLAGAPRIILSCRSMNPTRFHFHRPYQRGAYLSLLAQPNVVMLNNSAAGANSYAEWLGVPVSGIGVIRNGFDQAAFRPARTASAIRASFDVAPDAPVIGSVFRPVEEKRPFLWLDVAALVAKSVPQCIFVIVGDGPLRAQMQARAKTLGIAGSFRFIGASHDVAGLLSIMDAVLLTSRVEGLPNVLIEAQLMGVPVVASDVGGVAEAIDADASGWLIDGDDPARYAEPLRRLLVDRALRRQAADAATAFARDRFSLDRAVAETLRIYGMESPAQPM